MFLWTTSPKRQRRWSRALVRDGADARAAIATVLGLSAEQIGVEGPHQAFDGPSVHGQCAHSSGNPAERRPMKKVASYRVRIFGTPQYPLVLRRAMLE